MAVGGGTMGDQQELAPKGATKREAAWGEPRIHAALRERFAPPAYAYFPHVRNRTGYGSVTRTADAIAMSLYPSRGLGLHGIEIKSDRGDWLRELKDPSKAEEIAQHCDYWTLAVGDRDIVRPGELPPSWGLLAPSSGKLKMFMEPKPLGARGDSVPRSFVAAILRRAMEDSPAENAVREAVIEARKEWEEEAAKHHPFELEQARREVTRLSTLVEGFRVKSGIDIRHDWRHGEIGEAVRLLTSGAERGDHLGEQLEAQATALARAAEEVRKFRLRQTG